jgi:hypothetical protein
MNQHNLNRESIGRAGSYYSASLVDPALTAVAYPDSDHVNSVFSTWFEAFSSDFHYLLSMRLRIIMKNFVRLFTLNF